MLEGLEAQVNVVTGDLVGAGVVERALGEYEVDSVFHLAAQTIVGTANRSPASTWDTNLRGTWTVLEACRLHPVARVVVAASDKAYGQHAELPYREDFALQPRYPYDVSKAATDLIARSYWHTYELPVATTRFANLYGGGDTNRSRLVPEAIDAALAGRAAGHPLRRHARARLPLRRGRGGRLPRRSPPPSTATARAARPSTPAAASRTPSARSCSGSARSPAPTSSPTSGARARPRARSTASTSTRRSCASSRAGGRRWGSRRVFAARWRWYREHPAALGR